jgi:hypothetical protein
MTTTALPKQIQTQFIYELHMNISIQEVYKEDFFFILSDSVSSFIIQ